MIRGHVMFVPAFLACVHLFASEPPKPVSQSAKAVDSSRAIPVPKEDEWEHKTYSPDKKLFAIYFGDGWDEVISIHDATSARQIRSIVGHGDEVVEFRFADDGKVLASRCINSGRKGWAVWDVATGKLLMRLPDDLSSTDKPK